MDSVVSSDQSIKKLGFYNCVPVCYMRNAAFNPVVKTI